MKIRAAQSLSSVNISANLDTSYYAKALEQVGLNSPPRVRENSVLKRHQFQRKRCNDPSGGAKMSSIQAEGCLNDLE
jgi:hypothetical protein